jgi:Cu(I)/Ag(I) efflux system protein CusF
MKKLIALLAVLATAPSLHAEPVAPSTVQVKAMSEGVVRRIDAANGNITLKHGPLVNLDMPPMTMVFRAQPPELLNGIKVGDAVKFHAEEIDGTLSVTAIRSAQ